MKQFTNAVAFASEEEQIPSNFQPLTELPLIIMIGLTGVGKSTVLELLAKQGVAFTLLPNRRDITDQIIIASLQKEDGQTFSPVIDRVERFEYTARYRAKFPGGLAHAASQLVVDPSQTHPLLIFDGLRGLNEVQHATTYFPLARFVVLDAPDMTRFNRLLKRAEAFDTTSVRTSLASQNFVVALSGVPDIEAVFNQEQLHEIAQTAGVAEISIDTVISKITIIVEERRNYDPNTARVYLTRTLAPKQVLVVDTASQAAEAVAQRMADWLSQF